MAESRTSPGPEIKPSGVISNATRRGTSSAYVLPGPVHELNLIEQFAMFFMAGLGA